MIKEKFVVRTNTLLSDDAISNIYICTSISPNQTEACGSLWSLPPVRLQRVYGVPLVAREIEKKRSPLEAWRVAKPSCFGQGRVLRTQEVAQASLPSDFFPYRMLTGSPPPPGPPHPPFPCYPVFFSVHVLEGVAMDVSSSCLQQSSTATC